MDLEKLEQAYRLPEALTEALRKADLGTLSDLRSFYGVHGSFLELEGMDPLMEDKLLDLLTAENIKRDMGHVAESVTRMLATDEPIDQLPLPDQESTRDPADLDLEQLSILFGMSVRAVNVCRYNDLHYLSDIRRFDERHHGFKVLRNCGSKTQMELWEVLFRAAAHEKSFPAEISEDDPDQGHLEAIFQRQFSSLSKPARNVLLAHIGVAEAKAAIRFFMMGGHKMPSVSGTSRKVLEELGRMRRVMLRATSRFSLVEGPPRAEEHPPMLLEDWAYLYAVPAHLLPNLQGSAERMHLLSFLDSYLEVTGTRSKQRAQKLYLQQEGQAMSLQEIGDRVGLTRERVRQILLLLDKELLSKLAFIADIPNVKAQYGELIASGPIFMATPEITSLLNEREGTDWSPLFIVNLARILSGSSYIRCYWTDLFDRSAKAKALDLSMPLLIEEDLAPVATAMLTGLADLHKVKRRQSEELDLFRGQRGMDKGFRERLETVLKVLVAHRYSAAQFNNGVVGLPANKRRKQEDLLEDVLTSLDEPGHVSAIMQKWKEQFPEDAISPEGIRSIVVRGRSRFFSIGRSSTYGLRRWENERKNVKGGTIRGLVESQLRGTEKPLHIDQLTLGVQRFRPDTNVSSVQANLHLDQGERFTFFPNGFIGLTGKNYTVMPTPAPSGSLFRRTALLKYVGRPLSDLVDDLVERSNADRDLLNAKIQLLIHDRRLIVSPFGIVLHASSIALDKNEPESMNGELPFEQV